MTKLIHNNPYYYETVKRFLAVFNSIFDDIVITKRNELGDIEQLVNVPIAVGPKNKWLETIKHRPELQHQQVEITLPRLASEVIEYRYAQDRKIGTVGTYVTGIDNAGARHKIYNPVPYDAIIQLHSLTKTQDESLQILEQLLPYFSPSLLIEFDVMPEYNIKKVVPVSLSSVSVLDTYEGSPDEFRTVMQTFTFTARLDLFGPVNKTVKPIYQANSNMLNHPRVAGMVRQETIEAVGNPNTLVETVTIKP